MMDKKGDYMIDGLSREKTEILLRVENALFYLKMKSSYFPGWDKSEENRLELIRGELNLENELLSQQDIAKNNQ
jgi:hypothetical protein